MWKMNQVGLESVKRQKKWNCLTKNHLELQAEGLDQLQWLWGVGRGSADVQALVHLYSSMDGGAHPGMEAFTSGPPPHQPPPAFLMVGRELRTLRYPSSYLSRDRRTLFLITHRDLKILESFLDPKIIAKLPFLKHYPREWVMSLLH